LLIVICNVFVGLLSLIGISGLGRLLIRPLRPLSLHWYSALAMLAGFALSSVSVQCLAMAGSGRTGFKVLGAGIFALGIGGHWIGRGRWFSLPLPHARPVRTFGFSLVGLVLAVLVLISLAPSTKNDEVHYHMLTGRRVLEDHGLRVYQLPREQAILPQMGYQIGETVFHATNTTDAGNILNLLFGMVLWLMIYGVVTEITGRTEVGLLAVLTTAAGVYPAVWYVTAGPHALGDLATFTGVAALFFPGALAKTTDNGGNGTRTFAGFLGAVCAASTKFSLVPIGIVMTAAALFLQRGAARVKMGAVAAGLWFAVMGPLVIWTYVHTGSPFGAAFAQLFGRTAYQPAVLQALEDARHFVSVHPDGKIHAAVVPPGWLLRKTLFRAVQLLNGASVALMLCGAVICCRLRGGLAGLLFLVVLQVALIATLLPPDFRFLGGLQYGLLAAGALGLSPLWRAPLPFKWVAGTSLLLLGPWLAVELYYARPFAAVTLGVTTREDFLKRYVPFMDDFLALDKIVPRDADLYVPNNRMPAVYAPRPVIFTLADWDRRTPLYRLLVRPSGEPVGALGLVESQASLTCGDVVYRNPDAVVAAYRTPNIGPERAPVVVQRCVVAAGGQVMLPYR
jgi:hypothetical protein